MRLTDGSWICTKCRVLCSLKGYEEGPLASMREICSNCNERAEASWLTAIGDRRRLPQPS